MKGLGTNEKEIVNVLCELSAEQRNSLVLQFKTMYGKDLIDDLKSELGGTLEDCVIALMRTPLEYDAWSLRNAMKGVGTDESTLIEILATRSNAQIAAIKAKYAEMFKRDLEKDIISETDGKFKRMLVSLTAGGRSEDPTVDPAKAAAKAKQLHDAGEGRWGTDESEFNAVLVSSSYAMIRAIAAEYVALGGGNSLVKAIEKECSGDLKAGFRALVESVVDTGGFFAQRIHEACAGMGTNDEDLIRLVIMRSEVDMQEVKQRYVEIFGKTLAKTIKSECSGKYETILLRLIGESS